MPFFVVILAIQLNIQRRKRSGKSWDCVLWIVHYDDIVHYDSGQWGAAFRSHDQEARKWWAEQGGILGTENFVGWIDSWGKAVRMTLGRLGRVARLRKRETGQWLWGKAVYERLWPQRKMRRVGWTPSKSTKKEKIAWWILLTLEPLQAWLTVIKFREKEFQVTRLWQCEFMGTKH